MDLNKTIAAIATAPGNGAIAIIRISGKEALIIADQIFSGSVFSYKSHSSHFGKIYSKENEKIDDVLLLIMKGPNSYTGEDIVEIHCHGGRIVTQKVFQRVLEQGAFVAEPGEFTFRAFKNKKMDLTQAEAVQQMIGAKNELSLKAAADQLDGVLFTKIQSFQKQLVELAAILEASLDFPEEDLEFISFDEMYKRLESTLNQMQTLANTFEHGKTLHEGLSLCLCGSPNVGKSSLLNALLGKQRAIVTDIAGTTRDLLEDDLQLGGIHFKISDTAGIRETENIIEKEGIKRSKKAIESADIILHVLDSSSLLNENDKELIKSLPSDKTITIWNKIDLKIPLPSIDKSPLVLLSAKELTGIDELKQAIEKIVFKGKEFDKDEVILTQKRHKKALELTIESCQKVLTGLQNNISPEFSCSDLRYGLKQLATIIGTDVTEDILTEIFSKFCLGK